MNEDVQSRKIVLRNESNQYENGPRSGSTKGVSHFGAIFEGGSSAGSGRVDDPDEVERGGGQVRQGEMRRATQSVATRAEDVDAEVRDHVGDDDATGDECELLHVLLLRNCSMTGASNLL